MYEKYCYHIHDNNYHVTTMPNAVVVRNVKA